MATGNPYVPVTITGYNVTPPTDDGAQTAANTVEWAKHETKLSGPVKTGVDSTQTAIIAALDQRLLNSIDSKTGAYTVLTTDRGKILNFTGSSPATFTLLAAATAKVGFEIVIRNFGTAVLTLDGNAAETIDGLASVDLYPGQRLFMVCDGTNWLVGTTDLRPGVLAKTTTYTVLADDNGRMIDCDASGGAFTVTLPVAATAKNGFFVILKKTDSSANNVTIDADGTETIDGGLTRSLSGQFAVTTLVCDGTTWHVTQGASAGGLSLVSQATASSSATIEFTGLSSISDHYVVEIVNARPATDDAALMMRVSTDNGSTFISTASAYQHGEGAGAFVADTKVLLTRASAGDGLSNLADDFYNGRVDIWAPANTAKTHIGAFAQHIRANGTELSAVGVWGRHNTAIAVDAIQFLMDSGNIAEGEFRLYAVAKT